MPTDLYVYEVSFTLRDKLAGIKDTFDGKIFEPITPDEVLNSIRNLPAGTTITNFKMKRKEVTKGARI